MSDGPREARGCAREIIVLNRDRKGHEDWLPTSNTARCSLPAVEVREGDYADLKGASLVMIAAGVNEKPAAPLTVTIRPAGCDSSTPMSRSTRTLSPACTPPSRRCLVLVVTDPPDPLADAVRMQSSWLVAGMLPGIERQPRKKLEPSPNGCLPCCIAGGIAEHKRR